MRALSLCLRRPQREGSCLQARKMTHQNPRRTLRKKCLSVQRPHLWSSVKAAVLADHAASVPLFLSPLLPKPGCVECGPAPLPEPLSSRTHLEGSGSKQTLTLRFQGWVCGQTRFSPVQWLSRLWLYPPFNNLVRSELSHPFLR